MDVPHCPYWRKYSLGGAQVWYADWGDCPFDTGLHEPSWVQERRAVPVKIV